MLYINTERPLDYFVVGQKFFYWENQPDPDSNKPARLIRVTITENISGSACFFQPEVVLYTDTAKSGAGMNNPFILSENEVAWISQQLQKRGTRRYTELAAMARGNDAIRHILFFCHRAICYTSEQRMQKNLIPQFDAQKFLDVIPDNLVNI